MTTPTQTNEQTPQASQVADLSELSFADYERVRRGGEMPVSKDKSAPEAEKASGQKPESSESDTEETEVKESKELKDDSKSDEDDEESKDLEKDKPRKSGYQKRVDKLNARIASERARADALEERLARLEREADPKAKSVDSSAKQTDGKPDPDKFDTHAEYVEALTEWKLEQKLKAREVEQNKRALETEQERLFKAHTERVKAFAEKTEDFQEVLEAVDDVPVSAAVQEIIVSSENGPELMYALAKDRDEYARICKLPPLAAARAIGKIEEKLSAKTSEAKKTEPKKLTQAPKPIAPVGGNKGSVAKSIDDPDLPFPEYVKLRREQERRKRA